MLTFTEVDTYIQLHRKLIARAESLLVALTKRPIAVFDIYVVQDTYGLKSSTGLNVLVYYATDLMPYPMKQNIPFPLDLFLIDLNEAYKLLLTYQDSFFPTVGGSLAV